MSLYDEQIRQRYKIDEDMLASSYVAAENAIMGRSFSLNGNYPENAIGQILKYYHLSADAAASDRDMDADTALNAAMTKAGIMRRTVLLYGDWYKDSWGVYLARRKDTGEAAAIIPRGTRSLYYYDRDKAKEIKITKENAGQFDTEALCLYRPFPMRTLTLGDVIRFCFSTWKAGDVAYLIFALTAATLLGLLSPKISYFIFSQVAPAQSESLLLSTLIFGLCIGIAVVLLNNIYITVADKIGNKMRAQVEAATMMRVLTLPLEFFSEYSAGDLSERVAYMQEFCSRIMNDVVIAGLNSVFSLAMFSQIILYAPSLAIPAACVVIISLLFFWILSVYQYRVSKAELELTAGNMGMAYDTIYGIEKIKLAGAEKRMFARYGKDFSNVARVAYNPPLIIKLNKAILLSIMLAGQFLMYYLALKSGVDYAEYYAFQTAYASISAALIVLSTVTITASKLFGYCAMIKPIVETAPEINENLRTVTDIRGNIELNNVSFRYDGGGEDIIRNLNLRIHSGEYVAIVGKSGCGKSTLVRLMLGFVKPRYGAIFYDGKDLASLEKSSLRRRIGVVMQNDALFNGTIYENITVSVPGAPVETAWKAAEMSGIADDIRRFPMEMNTVIGEGSGGFSGGQKQRLVIARAVAPNPRILIFDEATSALDNKTQRQVSDALDNLKCTRIVIAHRLSTIKHCKRILYMEDGTIKEEGNYEELMALKGKFAELVERQKLDR